MSRTYSLRQPRSTPIALFSATLFVSAFLLFWIQLVVGKLLLPLAGGSAAVWSACLVFFQSFLLLGYGIIYLTRRWTINQQTLAIVLLLLVGSLSFPIAIDKATLHNVITVEEIFRLLTHTVGIPFLALSTLSPLLQRWMASIEAVNPYTLYAASNLGSIGSLVAFPLIIEPRWGLQHQLWVWMGLYGCVLVLVYQCGRFSRHEIPSSNLHSLVQPTWKARSRWLFYAFCPASLLGGITTEVSTLVAPMPLIWAIFLGLYLFTFVLVFAPKPQFLPSEIARYIPVLVITLFAIKLILPMAASLVVLFSILAFFIVAWECHSQCAIHRPIAQSLDEFYLCIALGGMLGGVFNAIVAPHLFNHMVEFQLMLVVALIGLSGQSWGSVRLLRWGGIAAAIGLLTLLQFPVSEGVHVVMQARSWFGAYRVIDQSNRRVLINGVTNHGAQSLTHPERPLSYYAESGPVGDLFNAFGKRFDRVAVVGLGAGTLSAYSQAGQHWDFIEIDPLVVKIAQRQFQFLDRAPGNIQIAIADGRLELAKSPDRYDLILLDAFSSDSIPVHLLTQDAIEQYLQKLNDQGIIAIHVSNRYLDLEPVIGRTAATLELANRSAVQINLSQQQVEQGVTGSHWIVLARDPAALRSLIQNPRWQPLRVGEQAWTDDFSSIASILRRN